MNTAFLLMAQYGAKAIIPLERVCSDYFSHLTPAKLRVKVAAGDIDLPLIRVDDNQKTASGVHLMDLAAYLDNQRAKAQSEHNRLGRRSQPKPVVQVPTEASMNTGLRPESPFDLIRMPEVRQLTGIGNSTIYKMIRSGDFPRQVKLGDRAVAWVRGEILEWRQMRIDASRGEQISS